MQGVFLFFLYTPHLKENEPMKDKKIFAVANSKGGTGKTSICNNLSGAFTDLGKNVLMIDMDQQGSLSNIYTENLRQLPTTIFNVLMDNYDLEDVIRQTGVERLSLVPANFRIKNLEATFSDEPVEAMYKLKDAIVGIRDKFDIIFIDCPPKLDLANRMALVAADAVIIPIECQAMALNATPEMLTEIKTIQKRINPDLRFLGFAINKFTSTRKLENIYRQQLRQAYPDNVFETLFRNHVQFIEAVTLRKPITHSHPSSAQANTCRKFVGELKNKLAA